MRTPEAGQNKYHVRYRGKCARIVQLDDWLTEIKDRPATAGMPATGNKPEDDLPLFSFDEEKPSDAKEKSSGPEQLTLGF